MTITSTYTQWPVFNTSWNKDAEIVNSTTHAASIQTSSTTISDSAYRTTDIEEPASVILNETGYNASASASESTTYYETMGSDNVNFDNLACSLYSNIPNSTTTSQSRFEQTLLFWTDSAGSLELTAPLHSYITCNVSNPGLPITASVTHRMNLAFYDFENHVLLDEVESLMTFHFTEQNYQNYDIAVPFEYSNYFNSNFISCQLTTELIAAIQVPEPATLVLLALGGLVLRKYRN